MIAGIVFNGIGISMVALAVLFMVPVLAIAGILTAAWWAGSPAGRSELSRAHPQEGAAP